MKRGDVFKIQGHEAAKAGGGREERDTAPVSSDKGTSQLATGTNSEISMLCLATRSPLRPSPFPVFPFGEQYPHLLLLMSWFARLDRPTSVVSSTITVMAPCSFSFYRSALAGNVRSSLQGPTLLAIYHLPHRGSGQLFAVPSSTKYRSARYWEGCVPWTRSSSPLFRPRSDAHCPRISVYYSLLQSERWKTGR